MVKSSRLISPVVSPEALAARLGPRRGEAGAARPESGAAGAARPEGGAAGAARPESGAAPRRAEGAPPGTVSGAASGGSVSS